MCYSFEASFTTVVVSYVAVVVLFWRNYHMDRILGIYAFIVGTMQLADANIWYLHNHGEDLTKCSPQNNFWTWVAYSTIATQFAWCVIAKWIHTKQRPHLLELALYGFCFAGIPAVINNASPCSPVPYHCSMISEQGHIRYGWAVDNDGGQKCHLKWMIFGEVQAEVPYPMKFITIILYLYSLSSFKPKSLCIGTNGVTLASWFFSFAFSDSFASVWCANANAISVFGLIAPYILGYRETNPDDICKDDICKTQPNLKSKELLE